MNGEDSFVPGEQARKARAGGKVIIVGEHAVVHGVAAIAAGLDRGVLAHVSLPTPGASRCEFVLGKRVVEPEDPAHRAVLVLMDHLRTPASAVHVELQMPAGVGLGASAAIGVAIARALLRSHERELSPPALLEAVNLWESVFHGSPSGIDAACVTAGGCIRFRRGEGFRPIRLGRPLQLVVAVAGPPSSTKEMVESVATLRRRQPQRFQQALDAVSQLVTNAEHALMAGDLRLLGELMNHNHLLLSAWMLSTPEIERACQSARAAGALGAKLTGAGGGGCVIALCAEGGQEKIVHTWREQGFECFATDVAPQP